MTQIAFRQSQSSDLELLLKWYDEDIFDTKNNINHKNQGSINQDSELYRKKSNAECFICYVDEQPVGYIELCTTQYVDIENELEIDLPSNTGVIRFYIGNINVLKQSLAQEILKDFLKNIAFKKYNYLLVDPKIGNEILVKIFENTGFDIIRKYHQSFWMVATNKKIRLPIKDLITIETSFERSFLRNDRLFIFGSRTNLQALGGDLDLYIETHASSVEEAVILKNMFIKNLLARLGDFKIDLVLNVLSLNNKLPIYEVAKQQGVLLNEKHT